MAKSRNKVELLGYLGGDPEVKPLPAGVVVNVSLATTERWKDKGGQSQERTEWHRLVFFNGLADIAAEYLKKGAKVLIDGSLRTRKWKDQGGNDRYTTEIVVSDLNMLGSGGQTFGAGYDDYPEANEALESSG